MRFCFSNFSHHRRVFLLLIASIAATLCHATIRADEPATGLRFVSFGWDGKFQVGRWTPLRVQLGSEAASQVARFEVEAPDADGNRAIVSFPAISSLFADSSDQFDLRFRAAQLEPMIAIRALDAEGTVLARESITVRVQSDNGALVGITPLGVGGPTRLQPLKLDRRMLISLGLPIAQIQPEPSATRASTVVGPFSNWELTALTSTLPFPSDSAAWESLDLLLLVGTFDFSPAQSEALRVWVLGGGHLILSLSPESRAGYSASPLAGWIPLELGDDLRLRELNSVETFVGRGSKLDPRDRVPAVRLQTDAGVELISSLNGSIGVQIPIGFGRVSVLGFDLASPPISEWPTFPDFLQKLAEPKLAANSGSNATTSSRLTKSGVSELATQLQYSQQQFSNLKSYSNWEILAWILLYAVLIGPLDYLIAHRVWKRPQITWVTFPLQIIVVTAIAIGLHQRAEGLTASGNQIDLIDIDETTQTSEIRSWLTVHGPESQRVQIGATSHIANWNPTDSGSSSLTPLEVTWEAIPEEGFRGLYRQSGFEFSSSTYRRDAAGVALENLPIEQWSTRSLSGHQLLRQTQFCRSELTASTLGTVSGSIEHRLPGELSEWILVYRNRVYYPRTSAARPAGITLPANRPTEITRGDISQSRDLHGYLTGTYQTRIEASEPGKNMQILVQQQQYNPLATDPLPILRILSFHDAVQGEVYTGLQNHALSRLDWTRQLDPHHAVLMGTLVSEQSAIGWNWNGEPMSNGRRITMVRMVLPVSLLDDSRRELPQFDPNK